MPFPANGILMRSLYVDFAGDVCDRLHHRVPHPGIVQGMARAFDKTNSGLAPHRTKRMRSLGRAEQIVTSLHDDAGNASEISGIVVKLFRLHEAVICELMRLPTWRSG